MKNPLSARGLFSLFLFSPVLAWGQAGSAGTSSALALDAPPAQTLNRFSLSYRMGFNMPFRFNGLGSFAPSGHAVPGQGQQPGDPGPAAGHGFNRTYTDGYNWVDNTGNALGRTRYWGYDSPSQVQGGDIVMHSTSSSGMTSGELGDEPRHGFEFTYNRELLHKGHWRGGLEAAFNYSPFSVRNQAAMAGTASQISDAYSLAGIAAPSAPYDGSYDPALNKVQTIPDQPVRGTTPLSDTITGTRQFDADLFGFRLGPYVEFQVSRKAALHLSAGFALVYAHSDFSFDETIVVPNVGKFASAVSSDHDALLPGGYVAGSFSYAFSEKWAATVGAQFQSVGNYTHDLNGREAALDLRQAIFITLGLSYSF